MVYVWSVQLNIACLLIFIIMPRWVLNWFYLLLGRVVVVGTPDGTSAGAALAVVTPAVISSAADAAITPNKVLLRCIVSSGVFPP